MVLVQIDGGYRNHLKRLTLEKRSYRGSGTGTANESNPLSQVITSASVACTVDSTQGPTTNVFPSSQNLRPQVPTPTVSVEWVERGLNPFVFHPEATSHPPEPCSTFILETYLQATTKPFSAALTRPHLQLLRRRYCGYSIGAGGKDCFVRSNPAESASKP